MNLNWLGLASPPTIQTPRLTLRAVEESDFVHFYKLFSDPRVNEYIQLRWSEPTEARRIFDAFKFRFEKGGGIRWSVWLNDTGEWVGNLGFHNHRPSEACIERGLQIASQHWRKGYGRESSDAAMDWMKNTNAYKSVDAWVAVENIPTNSLLRRQGFRDTGERKPFENLILGRWLKEL